MIPNQEITWFRVRPGGSYRSVMTDAVFKRPNDSGKRAVIEYVSFIGGKAKTLETDVPWDSIEPRRKKP